MKGLRDHDRRAGTAAGRALLPLSPHSGLLCGWPPPAFTVSPPQTHFHTASPPLPLSSTHLPRALRTQTESSREQELSLHF